MKSIHKYCSFLFLTLGASLVIFCLFQALYQYDNKYTAGPPYGKDGTITLSSDRLSDPSPIYLIDGWELYPDALYTPEDFTDHLTSTPLTAFIGQYPNFSFINQNGTPFGSVTYRLRVLLDQAPQILSLEIPELYTDYKIWIDGSLMAKSTDRGFTTFLSDGDTELILQVENMRHYYSGMTYPPALGTPETLERLFFIRTLFYGFLTIVALTLSLFSCVLWVLRKQSQLYRHFGAFCLCFFITCLHPFILRMGINGMLWYVVEDVARLFMLVQAMAFCSVASGLNRQPWYRRFLWVTSLSPFLLCPIFIVIIIPFTGAFINLYSWLLTAFLLLSFSYLCLCAADGLQKNSSGSRLISLAGAVLGASFFSNLLDNNHFEPIYTGWQMEYAGFLLVLVFGWLMVKRNQEILVENEQLFHQMESLVEKRTAKLYAVLEERKSFFSDMAHNLKAPIAAIRAFTGLMREQGLSLDEEPMKYLEQIEKQNLELLRRVQALSALNTFDRMDTLWETIDLNQLLMDVAHTHAPEAEACGIYFDVQLLKTPVYFHAQREKMMLLFENLVYNAFDFTPPEGCLSIAAEISTSVPSAVQIRVSDTGCGIAKEHLLHIFDRFYTVREHVQDGSGLGLYMAKMIMEEISGKIEATSDEGRGTTFVITIPVASL